MNYNEEILKADFIVDGRDMLPKHDTKEWGQRDPGNLLGACFHQSLDNYGIAKNVARYHVKPNHISSTGLPGLSYTMFVEKDGQVVLANGVECKTYSQGYRDPEGADENALYIGICFGGNFSGHGYEGPQEPTDAQLEVFPYLWDHLRNIWSWSDDNIYGHFDFGKPACPGYVLQRFIETTRPARFQSISERQKALQSIGLYRGDIDGMWGPASKVALIAFQKQVGLVADGVWGHKTTMAMREAILG